MISPELQARVDQIKAKHNYKSPQQQAQPQVDWFTATAPKPPLPFDMGEPTQESARRTATDTLKKTGGEIFDAAKSGVEKVKEGFNQSNTAKPGNSPLGFAEGAGNMLKGAAKMGAGAVETAFSPLAPVMKPIGGAIQKAGDALASTYGPEIERGLADSPTTLAEEVLPDVANLSTIAGLPAGVKAPKPIINKVGAATEKVAAATERGLTKARDVIPERPHPIDAIRGYADTKVKAGMQQDIGDLLKSTKSLAKKTAEAKARGTDFNEILSDPQIFQGLKVKDGRINPDDAILAIDERINPLMEAKRAILPQIDGMVPTTHRGVILRRAIEDIKGKFAPADEAALIKRIKTQVEALPEMLKPSQIDRLRAQFRLSARDAKGQMKSESEYAALENATRDTIFEITDNLPIKNAAEYKALNDYVKKMIQTKELLNGPIRGQTVKGGRTNSVVGRVIGTVAGASHGPLGVIAASYAGGVVADILTNNSLGSSFKMNLIRNITDDPAILQQAQRILKETSDQAVIELPEGQSALGNSQETNLTPAQTENTNPINQSIDPSIPRVDAKGNTIPEAPPNLRTGEPAPESVLSFLKNNITGPGSQRGMIKNPFGGKAANPVKVNIPSAAKVSDNLTAGQYKALKEWDAAYTSGDNAQIPIETDMKVQELFDTHKIEPSTIPNAKGPRPKSAFVDDDARASYISDLIRNYEDSIGFPKAQGAAPKTDMIQKDIMQAGDEYIKYIKSGDMPVEDVFAKGSPTTADGILTKQTSDHMISDIGGRIKSPELRAKFEASFEGKQVSLNEIRKKAMEYIK